jgi:aminopeptidase N
LADSELVDASQSWLDANPQAAAALRRVVSENRDGVARALAVQERDAKRD